MYGEMHESNFSRSVIPLEDINQDGFADILVASPNVSTPNSNNSQSDGALYLYYGGQNHYGSGYHHKLIGHNSEFSVFGATALGDIDDSGMIDLLISSQFVNSPNGAGGGYLVFSEDIF